MNIAAIELWALRAAALVAILFAIFAKGCSYGEDKIEAKYKTRDALALVEVEKQNAKNRTDEALRQSDVLVAEAAARQAALDLANYRRAHPIRGLLAGCVHTDPAGDSAKACAGAGDAKAVAACKATRLLQSNGTTDPGSRLDDLLAEADSINDSYGICLATRPLAPAKGNTP
jgi:hypothetical protein